MRIPIRFLLIPVILLLIAPLRAQDTKENAEFKLAVNLYNDGLYQAAEDQFTVFISKFPTTASGIEARFYLGLIQMKTKKYREARATFQDFAIRYPDNLKAPDAWWQAAQCHLAERNYAEAASLFARLKTFHPKSRQAPAALMQAATYFLKVDDLENAHVVLNSLLSEYPESEQILDAEFLLGRLLTESGEYDRALRGLRRVAENGTRPDLRAQAITAVGVIHSRLGARDEAEARFREVMSLFPRTAAAAEAGVRLADLQRQFRRFADAAAAYLAVARDSTAPAAFRQEAFAGAAACAGAEGDMRKSAGLYAELFAQYRTDSVDPDLVYAAADAFQKAGEFSAAGMQLERLLADTVVVNDRRRTLAALARNAVMARNFNAAVQQYQRYAHDFPDDEGAAQALLEVASITEREFRNMTRAIELYTAVVERDAAMLVADAARLGVARCLEQAGRNREALDMYRHFLAQYPASRHAAAARKAERDLARFQRGSADDALGTIAATLAQVSDSPGSARLDVLLGRLNLEALKDFSEADRCFAAAERKGVTGADAEMAAYGRALAALRLAQKSGTNRDAAATAMQDHLLKWPDGSMRADAAWELWLFRSEDAAPAAVVQAARDYLALKLDAHAVDVRCALADALRLSGRATEAEQEFTALITGSDPPPDAALFGRGLARQARQDYTGAIDDLRACDRAAPGGRHNAGALLTLGDIHARIGQYREAARVYEDLASRHPYAVEADSARVRMITALIQGGDLDGAEQRAEELVRRSSGNPFSPVELRSEYLYRYAMVLAHRGDAARTKQTLQRYIAQFPDGAHVGDAFFALGQIFRDEGKTQLATSYLQQAGAVPGNTRAGREAADLLMENGLHADAVREYEKLATAGTARAERIYALSRIIVALYRDNRPAEAAPRIEAFRREFPDATPAFEEFDLERGRNLLRQKKYNEAEDVFDELTDSDTKDIEAMGILWLGRLSEEKNDPKKAEAKFQEVLTDFPTTQAATEAALSMGRMALRAEKYEAAAGYFKPLLDRNTLTPGTTKEVLNGLITIYDELKMYDAAIEMTRRFVTQFPGDPTVFRKRVNMGVFYYQLRYFDQAVTHLQGLLSEASQDDQAEIRYYIGESHYYKGDFTQAALEFLKVPYLVVKKTEIDWRALAYYMTGQSYEKLSRYDSALEMYRKILELKDADPRDRAQAEKEINRLRELIK